MPDRRSERINAKWNMGEYLNQMIQEASLEYDIVNKRCTMTPMDSVKCLELQFIDFFTGLIWARYEFSDLKIGDFMKKNRLTNYKLFFE